MNLEYLRSFYQVAASGHFSLAAEELKVSKGLISRHIKALEAEFQSKLFHRTTRKVSLTEAGQVLYQHARNIISLEQQATQNVRDVTQEATGILRFTCPVTLGEAMLSDVLTQFSQSCPKVQVELNLGSEELDILNGDQDLALRASDSLDLNLVATPLGRLSDRLVASPEFIRLHGMPEEPQDLQRLPCMINSHRSTWNQWALTPRLAGMEREAVSINISGPVAVNQYGGMRALALSGVAIAKLPYHQAQKDLEQGLLVALLENWQISTHPLYLVHAQHLHLPKKIRLFKTIVMDWLSDHREYLVGSSGL